MAKLPLNVDDFFNLMKSRNKIIELTDMISSVKVLAYIKNNLRLKNKKCGFP